MVRGGKPILQWFGKLVPPLGRRAWWLLAGYTLSKVGGGFVSPFLVVYLSEVRQIGLGMAGLVLSVVSIAGTVAVPVAGWLTDRLGAGKTVVLSLLVAAAGTAGYAAVHEPWTASIAAVLAGAGNAAMWNGFATMLAEAVPPSERSGVFGVSFGLQNLGIGMGAMAGGLMADLRSPGSFVLLFLAGALGSLLFAAVVVFRGRPGKQEHADVAPGKPEDASSASTGAAVGGYRAALMDRALIGAALLNALAAFISGAYFSTAFPVWATGQAHSTTRVVGLAFLANTVVIVLSQLLVLRYFMKGRKRTDTTAAAILVFGVASLLTLLGGTVAAGAVVSLSLILSLAIFGLGETILQPSLYAWVNDLAPESLRGRYNAVFNLSWQVGAVAGPPLAGAALQHGFSGSLFVGLAVVCVLGAMLAVWLARFVPVTANLGQVRLDDV